MQRRSQRWMYGAKTAYVHQLVTILVSLSLYKFFPCGDPRRFPKIFWPFPVGYPDGFLPAPEFPCGSWWTERKGRFQPPPLLLASQYMNPITGVHLFHELPASDLPRVDTGFVNDVFARKSIVGDPHTLRCCFLVCKVEP